MDGSGHEGYSENHSRVKSGMRHIERSGLFKRQLILFAQDYKNRAGLETA